MLSWTNWKQKKVLAEGKSQAPNYSFDNWLKLTKQFGDEVTSLVGRAKEKDKELDDKKKTRSSKPAKDEEEDDDVEQKEKQEAWKKLRDIAKERSNSKPKEKE